MRASKSVCDCESDTLNAQPWLYVLVLAESFLKKKENSNFVLWEELCFLRQITYTWTGNPFQ